VASGGHGHTEDELRYVRRRYLSAEAARAIAVQIANATFAACSAELWGQGSTAVASDSTHVRAWADLLTPTDRRGLTPLFWSHVRPYGEVNLDMGARLNLATASIPGPRAPADQAAQSTVENEYGKRQRQGDLSPCHS
jgi:hypothetical protein